MKKEIFLCWSGKRSKFVAESLYEWIPHVIQNVKPWISSEDIYAGDKWFNEICKKLEKYQFGIICLTPENITSPWLLFEAGALAKAIEESSVCPYLIDLTSSDFKGPLAHFHSIEATEDGTYNLIKSINHTLGEDALNEKQLKDTFDRWWPDLKNKLDDLPSSEVEERPKRDDSDILKEILELVRSLARSDAKKADVTLGSQYAPGKHSDQIAYGAALSFDGETLLDEYGQPIFGDSGKDESSHSRKKKQ